MTKTLEQMLAELPDTHEASFMRATTDSWRCYCHEYAGTRVFFGFGANPNEALEAAINKMNGEK